MELERNYECPRCGMKAIVVVRGERALTPFQKQSSSTASLSLDDGMRREDDATTTLGLVACPSCGRRPPFALLWSALRAAGVGVGAVFVSLIGARSYYTWGMIPLVFMGGSALGALYEARRWGAAGKIVVLRTIAGPPPKAIAAAKQRAPRPQLAPPAPPAPVVAPLATVERDLPPPADPSGAPRFLK